MQYDVFISYSSADRDFADALQRRLSSDGVSVFIDTVNIGWGESIPRAISEALDNSRHIVCLLTPDYARSRWAEIERYSISVDDPDANLRKLLPILVRDTDRPRLLKPLKYMDCRSQEKFEREYPQMLRSIRSARGEHKLSIDLFGGSDLLAPLHYVFIVGRPASGKSTFAQILRARLAATGRSAELRSDYSFLQALFRLDMARGRFDRFERHPTSEFKVVDNTAYDEALRMVHDEIILPGKGNADVTVIEFSRPAYDTAFLYYTLKGLTSSAIIHIDAPLDLCIARNEHRRVLLQAKLEGADPNADVFAEMPELHYVPAPVFDRYRATPSQSSEQALVLALMPSRAYFNFVNDSRDLPRFKTSSADFIDNNLVPLVEKEERLKDYYARRLSALANFASSASHSGT